VRFSTTVIFGNSGAGKSTYAKKLVASQQAAHLDMDNLLTRGQILLTTTSA
jgi:adenylate kinase family enzyme